MIIELVVFDMAGTTVRDDDAVNRCLSETLATANVHATRDEINFVMGLPKPEAISALLVRKGGYAESRACAAAVGLHVEFQQRMINFYAESSDVTPMPDAEEVFRQLRLAGIRVALDTGFSRPIVNAILQRLGWDRPSLLDATVASDEVPRGRPHPDLIWKAMELTGVRAVSAVAKVGDTPSDLLEGTAAGCGLVVGVTNGSHTKEQLATHPHTHLISNLRELLPLTVGR